MQGTINRDNHAVDLGADHFIADGGVNRVCKINRIGTAGQGNHIALRRKDKYFVLKNIGFKRMHKFVRVTRSVFRFDQPGNPFQLFVDFLFGAGAALVFPMSTHTVFGNVMHLPGTDLHFKRNAVPPDNRGMKRTVQVGLGGGNIILETSGHGIKHLVDNSQNNIALGLGIYDNTQGIKIVNLVKALVLVVHFLINAVNRFDAPLQGKSNVVFTEFFFHRFANMVDKADIGAVLFLNVLADFRMSDRVQILQAQIFQFGFNLLHTQSVGKRCINMHGFQGGQTPLRFRFGTQRAHVVQSVAELNENNANVLGHCQKHLPQTFDMCLFLVFNMQIDKFGQSVDQHGNIGAEQLAQFAEIGFICAVLYRVVQKCRTNRLGVKSESRHDFRNRNGMRNVGFSAGTKLSFVHSGGIGICLFYDFRIVMISRSRQNFHQAGNIRMNFCPHN